MPQHHICTDCKNRIPKSADKCPHCGRPSHFPNVLAAEEPDELAALEERYNSSKTDAANRGAEEAVLGFEKVLVDSVAVLARPAGELLRLSTNDDEIYASYYQLLGAGVKSHKGDKISTLRAIVDEALFPGYKENIRFAALSLDDMGLTNYGDCSVVLRTDMIGHRASVFEDNSTVFLAKLDVRLSDADELPLGYRATWANRPKLCVAKLSQKIDASTLGSQYSGILLHQGATTASDDFVEVHIWGSITARAFQEVTLRGGGKQYQRVIIKALKEKFANADVSVKVK
jgi:hypothetical protein